MFCSRNEIDKINNQIIEVEKKISETDTSMNIDSEKKDEKMMLQKRMDVLNFLMSQKLELIKRLPPLTSQINSLAETMYNALKSVHVQEDAVMGPIIILPDGLSFPCERRAQFTNILIVREAHEHISTIVREYLVENKHKQTSNKTDSFLILGSAGSGKVCKVYQICLLSMFSFLAVELVCHASAD
jgi:hypothetical protein